MILEIVNLTVADADDSILENEFLRVHSILSEADGCVSYALLRQRENRSEYVLLITWESIEAHVEKFRTSPRRDEFVAALRRSISTSPRSAHYDVVVGSPPSQALAGARAPISS
jgi:heme-degrading monooxygenase HmoA